MNERSLRYGTRKCYVIPVTKICNAQCVFCATDVYDPKPGVEFLGVQPKFDNTVAHLIHSGISTFEVTGGGEPTLNPAIARICESLNVAGTGNVRLYTNGIRILQLPRLSIDELCLSRCAFDAEKNQQIMHLAGGSPDLIEQLNAFRRMGYGRIKLSVPLVAGGVQTFDDAMELVHAVRSLVKTVVFRPMYPATPNRSLLVPHGQDASQWQAEFTKAGSVIDCDVEFDADGCFRSTQLILAANGALYGDWSLKQELSIS